MLLRDFIYLDTRRSVSSAQRLEGRAGHLANTEKPTHEIGRRIAQR